VGVAAALGSSTALGAPQLQSIEVTPNPVVFQGAKTPEVIITVTVERARPFDFTCDAAVDAGDGGRGTYVSWSFGDQRSKTTRYQYRKPGKYRMTVSGTGNAPCLGKREVVVTVRKR
jgi:PKD domain